MKRRTYQTLQAWMEATQTTTQQLGELAGIDPTHMSKILSRSRRCSLEKAWRLHEITGVPVKNLIRWMKDDRSASFEQTVKTA